MPTWWRRIAGPGAPAFDPPPSGHSGTIQRATRPEFRLRRLPQVLHSGALERRRQKHGTRPQGPERSGQRLRSGAVRLVHDHEVGHLEQSGLRGLHRVPETGRGDRDAEVGETQDRVVALPHAGRFEEDALGAAGREQPQHRGNLGGQTRFPGAGGHAPEEDRPRVSGEPHPVAEQGASRSRARWVHGQHGHPATGSGKRRRQAIRQLALPHSRGTGQGDHPGPFGPIERQRRLAGSRGPAFHQGDRAAQRAAVTGGHLAEQPGAAVRAGTHDHPSAGVSYRSARAGAGR